MGACTSTAKWEEMPTVTWPQKNEGVVVRLSFHYDPARHVAPHAECLVHKVQANTGINKIDVVRSEYVQLSDHKLVAAPAFLNTIGSLPFSAITGMSGFILEDFSPAQLEPLKSLDVTEPFWKQLEPDTLEVENQVFRAPQLKAQSIAFAEEEWAAWVRTHWVILDELNNAQKKGKEPEHLNASRKQDKIGGEPLVRLDGVKTTKGLTIDELHRARDNSLASGIPFRQQLRDHDVSLKISAVHSLNGFRPYHSRLDTTATKTGHATVYDAREYIFLWSDVQGKTKSGPHEVAYPESTDLKSDALASYAESVFKSFLKTTAKHFEKAEHGLTIDVDGLSVGVAPMKQAALFKAPVVKQEAKGDAVDEKAAAKDDSSLRLQHFLAENGRVVTPEEYRDNTLVNIQVGQILHPNTANQILEITSSDEGRDIYNIQSPVHHNVPARLTMTAETRVRSGSSRSTTPTHSQAQAAANSFHAPHVGDVFNAGSHSRNNSSNVVAGSHSRHGSNSRPPSAPSSGRARVSNTFTFDSSSAGAPPPLMESAAEGGKKDDVTV